MRHAVAPRRLPRRPPRPHGAAGPPVRTLDLVLALLAVALLGGLALAAAAALAGRILAP
ncbi:hypothetical protein [Methylobacterium sp. A54F]